jgi:phospholipid N-methyltransferase
MARFDLDRLKLQRDERLAFLQAFLRSPQQVASVIPSSRFLERRLVALADLARTRLVVELGPGTGGTTRALLKALPAEARLLCIELEPRFAALLRAERDARLVVHEGSAEDLQAILAQHGFAAPDAVISGIPFSTIPPLVGDRIIRAVHGSLAPGGRFVAYQVRGKVAELARPVFGAPDVTVELRNIPPARIFRWHSGGARLDAGSATVEQLRIERRRRPHRLLP